MILLNLNSKSKTPLFKQVFKQLIKMIESGILKPGDKLPSTRLLAKHNELSRTTVYKAYEELWALGYIESKSGSYSTIRQRTKEFNINIPSESHKIKWDEKISCNALHLTETSEKIKAQSLNQDIIDFTPLSPDPEIIPNKEFRKCLNETLRENDAQILLYGDSVGYKPLRKVIARQMQLHSINVSPSEIIITNGAQNALELILKLFIEPKDEVIIERPTYSEIIPLLKYYQAKIIEIPVNDNGLDLDILEAILEKHQAKLLYTMPNFHNPTGLTSNQAHRERLLEICEKHQLAIVEDGFVEEMKYLGKNILPIKSMDKTGLVFYVGTFSKVLFPGLRIGWIASNKNCTNSFSAIKKISEISGNTLNQAALELFCNKGLYEVQLKKIHKVYRKRMHIALKTLRENIQNSNIKYSKPIGGYTIWFEIQNLNLSESELIQILFQNGVSVTPGNGSFFSPSKKLNFRISIAHRTENEIEHGIKKIAQILNNLNKI